MPAVERVQHALPPRSQQIVRFSANLIGAAGAAYFAYVTFSAYLHTHRPIGILFFAQQAVVVVAYLVRRPASTVTLRSGDWLLAFGGTFSPVLLRPDGAHAQWGQSAGLALQLVGVIIALWSLTTLGRSFGFAAADRGLVSRGPYSIVRHPVYAAYVLLLAGYLCQSFSLRNVLVALLAISCDVGRIRAEERILAHNPSHPAYCRRVRWRLVPGLW